MAYILQKRSIKDSFLRALETSISVKTTEINLEGFKRKIQSQSIPIIEILGKAEDVKEGITHTKLESSWTGEGQNREKAYNKTSNKEGKFQDSSNKQMTVIQVLFAISESGALLVEETQFKPLFNPENGQNIVFLLKESSLVENIEIALSKMQFNKENAVTILKPNRLPKDSALVILKNR